MNVWMMVGLAIGMAGLLVLLAAVYFLYQFLLRTSAESNEKWRALEERLQTASGQMARQLGESTGWAKSLSDRLQHLSQTTERVLETSQTLTQLQDLLKPPQLRGPIGEALLENLLREVLPQGQLFHMQHAFKTGERVDAVIELKEGLIPIDAKFPLDAFRRIFESSEAQKPAARREFDRALKRHIDDIAKKYILPDEGTFDFALMYIPAENVYYECIVKNVAEDSALLNYAASKRVFPVSPNSFYPYLLTLALGLKGLKMQEDAKRLWQHFGRLSIDLGRFSEEFRIAIDHVGNAQKKLAEAEKKLFRLSDRAQNLTQAQTTEPEETQKIS